MGAATGSGRTQEQTDAAYFWSDNTPVQWHRTLRAVASTYLHDIGDSARLFALASFAAADAVITCWETKLHYNYWRPVTAIHQADADGNPGTHPDSAWKPLLNTPNYPDYSSGANVVTGAMTCTLELFFGTDAMTLTITSNSANLPPEKRARTFTRYNDTNFKRRPNSNQGMFSLRTNVEGWVAVRTLDTSNDERPVTFPRNPSDNRYVPQFENDTTGDSSWVRDMSSVRFHPTWLRGVEGEVSQPPQPPLLVCSEPRIIT